MLGKFTCALRKHVSVPESNNLSQVAPTKPVKLVPFQAGANTFQSSGVEMVNNQCTLPHERVLPASGLLEGS